MINIYFYQAECGDAARIQFQGDDGKIHHVFIDAGYRRTFSKIIKQQIKDMIKNNESIDSWIISHIHDDHIGGIEQYIKDIQSGELKDIVSEWIYNAPRITRPKPESQNKSISRTKSIRQGDLVTDYLIVNKKLMDSAIISKLTPININGLSLYILSPSKGKLQALQEKYKKDIPLEKIEGEAISRVKARIQDDYHINLNDFDLSDWEEDDSMENGSSISVLTDYKGIKVLWLADAHPTDIVSSLKNLGYTPKNKLDCKWVKVTHHGSKANNSDDLYDLIECSNYLFSADGINRHKLPAKESIARILRNKNRNKNKHYKLYFTYDNPVLRNMFKGEDNKVYVDLNFSVEYLSEGNYFSFSI